MEPIVSVVIPCRNEEKYIKDCIVSILKQVQISDLIEILVIDGMSEDRTEEIVHSLGDPRKNIKIIKNPKKTTPAGLNLGIKNSKGRFIAIFGAHSKYGEDYLLNCIKLFNLHPEISCVGGPITHTAKTAFGKAVALAMSSRIGVGNAKHRFSDYEGYAEGACFPVFKREVFETTGMYDESLIRNQDDELNFRLKKHNLKIFISNKIISYYSVRELPLNLFNQYFEYGFWRTAVIKKHKQVASMRQLAPPAFFLFVFFLIILAPLLSSNDLLLGIIIPSIYSLVILSYSFFLLFREGVKTALFFPIVVIIMHFAYTVGFLSGIKNISLRIKI